MICSCGHDEEVHTVKHNLGYFCHFKVYIKDGHCMCRGFREREKK